MIMNEPEIAESMANDRVDEPVIKRIVPQEGEPQRREHPRFSVNLDVSLGSEHNFYAGFAENLSAGGIFVATHMLKAEGEIIDLTIHLADAPQPVRGRGEVRWIREYNDRSSIPPGMGIRFVELETGSLESIQAFLSRRDPMFFDDE
jgi:uncharacterized protein (TIGR02266 family)